jgi:hypothetical protein
MRSLIKPPARRRREEPDEEMLEMERHAAPIYALMAIAGLVCLGIFIWSLTHEPPSSQRHSAAPSAVPATLPAQLGLRRSWVHPLHVLPGYRDEAMLCRRD